MISAHVPTDPPALSNTDPACVPFLRTQRRLSAWRKIGAPARILSWLSKGVPLPWSQRGPPPRFDHGQYLLTDPDEIAAWQELRAEYTQTRAIQPIPAQQARYVSRAFMVKKPTEHGRKKFRLVIDLRKVNRHLRKLGLRYERLKDFGHLLHRDDWMIGFDIKNAYHHLRILEAHRQFLQFRIAGELFECVALPFGLSASPYCFTHLMCVVVRFLRNPKRACPKRPTFPFAPFSGAACLGRYYDQYSGDPGSGTPADLLPYLDDFLAAMRQRSELELWVQLTKPVFQFLGFEFKEIKCQWQPVQCKEHLGLIIDTRRELFLVPLLKEQRLREAALQLQRSSRVVARHLARFCGQAISVSLAFPPARFLLQALYDILRKKRSWRDRLLLTP